MPGTGVTPTGFVAETTADLLTAIESDELANVDAQLDVSPEEPIGQVNGIMAAKLSDLWELGAVAYNSLSRDDAEGSQLDNIGTLTGTKRLPAKPTICKTCTVVFSQTGTYAAGTLTANVSGQPSATFVNQSDIVISGSVPKTLTNQVWVATSTGPTVANAGTLDVITTPVTGWTSITNINDATLGTDVETDTAYRIRQANELSATGACTVPSIQADLLQVAGVISVSVLENTTNFINADGLPPHTFSPVIWDGTSPQASNDDIAQVIWDDKPAGIQSVGLLSGDAIDDNGVTRTMQFNRAIQVTIYVAWTCTLAPGVSTGSIAPLVKEAAVAYAQANIGQGSEVVALAIRAQALTIPGVIDVPTFAIGTSPSPSLDANITIPDLSIAVFDTSRMTVNGL